MAVYEIEPEDNWVQWLPQIANQIAGAIKQYKDTKAMAPSATYEAARQRIAQGDTAFLFDEMAAAEFQKQMGRYFSPEGLSAVKRWAVANGTDGRVPPASTSGSPAVAPTVTAATPLPDGAANAATRQAALAPPGSAAGSGTTIVGSGPAPTVPTTRPTGEDTVRESTIASDPVYQRLFGADATGVDRSGIRDLLSKAGAVEGDLDVKAPSEREMFKDIVDPRLSPVAQAWQRANFANMTGATRRARGEEQKMALDEENARQTRVNVLQTWGKLQQNEVVLYQDDLNRQAELYKAQKWDELERERMSLSERMQRDRITADKAVAQLQVDGHIKAEQIRSATDVAQAVAAALARSGGGGGGDSETDNIKAATELTKQKLEFMKASSDYVARIIELEKDGSQEALAIAAQMRADYAKMSHAMNTVDPRIFSKQDSDRIDMQVERDPVRRALILERYFVENDPKGAETAFKDRATKAAYIDRKIQEAAKYFGFPNADTFLKTFSAEYYEAPPAPGTPRPTPLAPPTDPFGSFVANSVAQSQSRSNTRL